MGKLGRCFYDWRGSNLNPTPNTPANGNEIIIWTAIHLQRPPTLDVKESAIEKNTIVTWISSTTHLPQETKNSVFCVVAQDLLLLLTIWTWKSVTQWVLGITELSIWELPFRRCGGKHPRWMDGPWNAPKQKLFLLPCWWDKEASWPIRRGVGELFLFGHSSCDTVHWCQYLSPKSSSSDQFQWVLDMEEETLISPTYIPIRRGFLSNQILLPSLLWVMEINQNHPPPPFHLV